ncbi:hypothetical protein [Candidatus Paracaedibacter symbiosus]|uniref:hypothetical protein n=1 Tax=Candidatus Paracaedibacter symbiosus TaxID=244582 RepID=UPI000509710E|nr:hypothetical protein [Candidatus Paracaedibacter symbiosus]
MQKSSSNEEYEHSIPKKSTQILPQIGLGLDPDIYVNMLNEASTEETINAILQDIPCNMREEVLNQVEKKSGISSSSSSSAQISLNPKPSKKRLYDDSPKEQELQLRNKKLRASRDEDNQMESGKRKSIKDNSLKNGIKSKKARTVKKEDPINPVVNFDALPSETIVHILEFIPESRDILNCRLINTHIKNLINKYVPYPSLSLQQIFAAFIWKPELLDGRNLCLYGWAPTLKEIYSFLPSKPTELSGHVFVSDLQVGFLPICDKLKITLTIPKKNVELAKKELEDRGLSASVQIRTQESLWDDFIKTELIEKHSAKKLLSDNINIFLPLLEVDGEENFVKAIFEHFSTDAEVNGVIRGLTSIPGEILPHFASLLNAFIIPLCQDENQLKEAIMSFFRIKEEELPTGKKNQNFWQISRLLLKTINKCQNGYQIKEIIDGYLKIQAPMERNTVSKFLNEKIYCLCQNGSQPSKTLNTLAEIKNKYKRELLMASLNQEILNKCQDWAQAEMIIKTLANINSGIIKEVINLSKGEIFGKCQDGYQVEKVINSLGKIQDSDKRQHVVKLLKKRFLDNHFDGYQVGRIINSLAKIGDKDIRQHVVKLFYDKCLDKCQDGFQVKKIIRVLADISDNDKRQHVMKWLKGNSKILKKCQDGFQVKKIIRVLAGISDNDTRDRVVKLLDKKILDKCQDGFQVKKIIRALVNISDNDTRDHVASELKKKIPAKCQNGDQLEQIIYAIAILLPFDIQVII